LREKLAERTLKDCPDGFFLLSLFFAGFSGSPRLCSRFFCKKEGPDEIGEEVSEYGDSNEIAAFESPFSDK
jgi:hypothetical protein